MTPRTTKKKPSTDETRLHILAAGHELLAAAKGALNYCLSYAEQAMPSAPHLAAFFKKSIAIAEDLSAGLLDREGMKKAVKSAMPPLFTMMEMEMGQQHKAKSRGQAKSRKVQSKKRRSKKSEARGKKQER